MIISLLIAGREGRGEGVCELLFKFLKFKMEFTGYHINNFLEMQKTK